MEVVTDQKTISKSQEIFRESIQSLTKIKRLVSLGFQGGQFEREVYWIPDLNLWAYFGFPGDEKSPGKRYWNAFGFGEPGRNTHIQCEINPPIQDRNRRTGGVFLQDNSRKYFSRSSRQSKRKGANPKTFLLFKH